MEYASRRLRVGRILARCLGLAAAVWLLGRSFAALQQGYLDQRLVQAAASDSVSLVDQALRSGANPNSRTVDGYNFRVPVLFVAIRNGDPSLCRELLRRGARPEAREIGRDGRLHFNGVMEAARLGKARLVRLFLDHGADPNTHDDDGFTALMCAAISGDTATVQVLMDRGADVNQRDQRGFSPLLMAEARHRDAVWTQLSRAGATR